MKACSKCNQLLEIKHFAKSKKTFSGHNVVLVCMNGTQSGIRRIKITDAKKSDKQLNFGGLQIKQEVDELKKGPCVDCQRTFPPICMDFDHL